jgi:hypothetical protein
MRVGDEIVRVVIFRKLECWANRSDDIAEVWQSGWFDSSKGFFASHEQDLINADPSDLDKKLRVTCKRLSLQVLFRILLHVTR